MKTYSNHPVKQGYYFANRVWGICCAIVCLLAANAGWAAPFRNLPISFTQPDGTRVNIIGNGDEFSAVFETADGYTVAFDPVLKAYCFAKKAATGELVPSDMQIHLGNPAAGGLEKHLRPDQQVRSQQAQARHQRWENALHVGQQWNTLKGALQANTTSEIDAKPPTTTTLGDKLGLCLLIDFDDDPATIPQSDINDFCNGDNFSKFGNNGSVRKYYSDNSNGKLNYSNVVTIYVRIPNSLHPKSYYNDVSVENNTGHQANLLIKDALDILKGLPNYTSEILPTFDKLTVDSDNQVVAFNVFYAGGNGNVWMSGLWPHSWALYEAGAQELSAGGKKVFKYQISNIGDKLELGTFCHENGHMLCGYPDLYDYDYDSTGGAGEFCLMAAGSFGGNPSQICAYLKRASGWATVTEMTSNSASVNVVSASGTNFNHFYRFEKPGVPTEYFLIENRYATGRDSGLPASGIAIWHIDELGDRDNQSLTHNTTHSNYEATLVQADNKWDFENNVNQGDPNDLYYSGNNAVSYNNQFTDTSAPNASWWDGTVSGILLHSFSAPAIDMSFRSGAMFDIEYQTNFVIGGNGNGKIDPNECNSMFIVVTNRGTETITGVRGFLSTATPGVFIATGTANFSDVPGGTTATCSTPFSISTAPDFVCGTPIAFTFAVKTDQGTQTNQFTVTTGSIGLPIAYGSYSPMAILDGVVAGSDSPITVANVSGALAKVQVSVFAVHPFVSELTMQLIGPDGTSVLLVNTNGFGTSFGFGCDSFGTTFDDDATQTILQSMPPYYGVFKPLQPLAAFANKSGTNVNGDWKLRVIDNNNNGITGVLDCWSLTLIPYTCTDGGGECPGVDLSVTMSATPNPAPAGSILTYSMVVSNAGPSSANNVSLSQSLPADSTFVSAGLSQGSYAVGSGVLNCNLGYIGAGKTATVTVVVVPTKSGTVSSTAMVSSPAADYKTDNNWATVSTVVTAPRADLSISMTDSPDPVLAGGLLTYNVTVVNNGPSIATNVVVTNYLPASVLLNTVSVSQGLYYTSANTILANIGVLPVNGTATITMTANPLSIGLITASAVVNSDQSDPVQSNNRSIVTTTVSQAADLAVSISALPSPVLISNLLTYTVVVTNMGPGNAQGVNLIQHLPAGITMKGAVCGTNTVTTNADLISVYIPVIPTNGSAVLTVVVQAPAAPATLTSSVSVSSLLKDPNPANNTDSCVTVVAPPMVDIRPAGSALVSESMAPTNGVIDVNERVSVTFWLRNSGTIAATNVTATLLPTGGVMSPSPTSPLSYGNLAPGASASQTFAFTATGSNTLTASLWVTATSQQGSVSVTNNFTFALPTAQTFSNTNKIVIPSKGEASPYPATNFVSGVTGAVEKVTATLINFTHTYPHDVSVLLVSPAGRKSVLMSHGGGFSSSSVTNISLTFDDAASIAFPETFRLVTGSYRPAGYPITYLPYTTFTNAGPYETNMTTFAGTDPNGTWSLYVIDDSNGDLGAIADGWSLAITTISSANNVADLSMTASCSTNRVIVGSSLIASFSVTNLGPNVANNVVLTNQLPSGLVFADGKTSFTTNIAVLPMGSGQTVSKVVKSVAVGTFTDSASARANQVDLNYLNNASSLSIEAVLPTADVAVSVRGITNMTYDGNLVYNITVTNAGPQDALSVVVTNLVPADVVLGGSAASWNGTWSTNAVVNNGITNQVLRCDLGTLASGQVRSVSWSGKALHAMSLTNTVTASTTSSDPNLANNIASFVTTVVAPVPVIVPAGTRMMAEDGIADRTIDPGETVTILFNLANIGQRPTTNLVAQIQPNAAICTNGQSAVFGAIAIGATNSCPVTFKALANSSNAVAVVFDLYDSGNYLGNAAFSFTFPVRSTFSSAGAIIIPDSGPASPYPAGIVVSNLAGVVSQVSVTLNGVTHTFPRDINAMLVSPVGQKLVLMSHAGSHFGIDNVCLTFTNAPALLLASDSQITSGSYQPGNFATPNVLYPGDPSVTNLSDLSGFSGIDPNGTWSLYVLDDSPGDSGKISRGWDLSLVTLVPLAGKPAPVPAALSLKNDVGLAHLFISGQSGMSYSIEVSTNLTSWTPVTTMTAPLDGNLIFDLGAHTNKAYFYRVISLP